MIGRALPTPFEWRSVPPAPSLSFVWGAGGCTVTDAAGVVELGASDGLFLGAQWPHEGRGHEGSDFLTVFRWGDRAGGRRVGPLDPALREAAVRAAAATLAARAPDPMDAARLSGAIASGGSKVDLPRGNLRRAKALLDEQFRESVDLDALSDRAGLSRSELVRQFKQAYGLTPIQYRKQRRLLAATEDLRAGESVTEAALGSGFADAAHLTRTFRAQYGAPPSEWRDAVSVGSTPSADANGPDRPPPATGSGRGPGG